MLNCGYRPRLVHVEDRVAPGALLSALDGTSLFFGESFDCLPRHSEDPEVAGVVLVAEVGDRAAASPAANDINIPGKPGREPLDFSNPVPIVRAIDDGIFQDVLGGDTVAIRVLSGSSVSINSGPMHGDIGDDLGTLSLQNVRITNDGSGAGIISVAQQDIGIPQFTFRLSIPLVGTVHFAVQIWPQSDGSGTYDRNSGSATMVISFRAHLDSNDAPGFDHNSCNSPVFSLHVSTDDPNGGQPFATNVQGVEEGTLVDSAFFLGGYARGTCGNFIVLGDYALFLNDQVHLPAPGGSNSLTLHVNFDQSIGP